MQLQACSCNCLEATVARVATGHVLPCNMCNTWNLNQPQVHCGNTDVDAPKNVSRDLDLTVHFFCRFMELRSVVVVHWTEGSWPELANSEAYPLLEHCEIVKRLLDSTISHAVGSRS
jgi:hypothetical protein